MLYSKKFKWIESVGVELEGGIYAERLDRFLELAKKNGFTNVKVGYDGSVYVYPPPVSCSLGDWIPDVEIKFHSTDIDELLYYVEALFLLGFRQNNSCGNHHHFKFTSQLAYSALASEAAYKQFVQLYSDFAWKNGSKYIARMTNSYCKVPRDEKMMNAALFAMDRYYAINFCATIKHRTLEIRILPHADNFEEFRNMHLWLCRTVNKLISNNIKRLSMTVSW